MKITRYLLLGTCYLALAALGAAQVSIPWTDVDKTGSSLADLATRSATDLTTGTLNAVSGAITLVSAAGATSWQSFTVTNSAVAATDVVIVNQKSGADKYMVHVTSVAAGSFVITYATTGGTTTEQPVLNFAVIKAVSS